VMGLLFWIVLSFWLVAGVTALPSTLRVVIKELTDPVYCGRERRQFFAIAAVPVALWLGALVYIVVVLNR
jgi:hypothetical protein